MLRFIDSMAHYNNVQQPRKWTNNSGSTWNSSGGRRNAPNISVAGNAITKTLTHMNRLVQGAAVKYSSAGGGNLCMANNSVPIATLQVNSDGTISLIGGTVVIGSSVLAVADKSSWHFYEMDATLSGGTSTITVTGTIRVDGLVFGTFTGASNILGSNLIDNNATANQVGIVTNGTLSFMDYYCLDGNATDFNGNANTNTAFLGDVEIDAIFPAADKTTNWTRVGGDGTHAYTCVNENPADDDTSYVYTSNTATTSEGFTYQPISGFTGTILGAQYLVCAKKDTEGIRAIDQTVGAQLPWTIEFQGTHDYLSDFYVYYIAPLDTDVGVAWTTANLSTETFGFQCVL